jgi:hypothetical protein
MHWPIAPSSCFVSIATFRLCSPHHRHSFVTPIVFRSSVFFGLPFLWISVGCIIICIRYHARFILSRLSHAGTHTVISPWRIDLDPSTTLQIDSRRATLSTCSGNSFTYIILAQSVYIRPSDTLALLSHY